MAFAERVCDMKWRTVGVVMRFNATTHFYLKISSFDSTFTIIMKICNIYFAELIFILTYNKLS